MEIIQKILRKTSGDRLLRTYVLLFLFSIASVLPSIAQEVDSAANSASTVVVDGGSDGFAKKENTSKLFEEARKIAEKNKRDQILQYVFMVVGFSFVIGIAWFTTVLAKKRKKKDDEIKAIRLQQMKNKVHPPRR